MSVVDGRARRQGDAPPARRLLSVVLVAALAAAALTPQSQVEGGPVLCPFRLLTDLPCPACGLTRSWVHLAHGDMGQSIASHAAGPIVFTLAMVVLAWAVRTRAREPYPRWLRQAGLVTLVATASFGLARLVLAMA